MVFTGIPSKYAILCGKISNTTYPDVKKTKKSQNTVFPYLTQNNKDGIINRIIIILDYYTIILCECQYRREKS